MKTVHCFGAGLVGSYVARKLAEEGYNVQVYDLDSNISFDHPNITVKHVNAMDVELSAFGTVDLVVNMLPGDIGYDLTRKLSGGKWPIVDLSFSEITPDISSMELSSNDSRILWDVGIAPGLSNMLLYEAHRVMGNLSKAEIRVGGNPTKPDGAWKYMAPFSPKDVIAEYTRPARVIRNSEVITIPALSERHFFEVKGKGIMEAFLTDGLRSVLANIPAEEMSEYTVRWPGHIQKFIDQRDSGKLDEGDLLEEWRYYPEKSEFTWLEVVAHGAKNRVMRWEIIDHGHGGDSSMARTTGLVTVGCIISWLENPSMLSSGDHPPENLPREVLISVLELMRVNGIEISGPEIS